MSPLFRRADRRTDKQTAHVAHEPHLVTLIRKPGCHLCDDAHAVIEKVCGELGVAWEEKDVTQDEELYQKYWEQIPVVLVDGEQHTFWRVNEQRLRKALT
ncbi:glutaredoxin family protein [Streptomyces spongiae]|uniref:Glutaredoxin family protein n=1 Tax=Streptomyces spongiae TaxID=565072 RepID=A0A5N8XQW3_9ACTN|nr:glutaredoxin family protein [Streptomyces spongiae]MPY61813.1 glutaredoxin family protein [Streptomyces spongiae]